MYVREGLAVRPLKVGGSGVQTYNKKHPAEMPTALEAGTLNGHGIAGLDAAIGYLENDEENKRIFAVAARALRKGGRHFMDIMNGGYAESHFPCRLWDAGEKGLTLSVFEWLEEQKTLLYGQADYPYGQVLSKPEIEEGNPIRLYTLEEVMKLAAELGLHMQSSYADYSGSPSSDNAIQLLILLRK